MLLIVIWLEKSKIIHSTYRKSSGEKDKNMVFILFSRNLWLLIPAFCQFESSYYLSKRLIWSFGYECYHGDHYFSIDTLLFQFSAQN